MHQGEHYRRDEEAFKIDAVLLFEVVDDDAPGRKLVRLYFGTSTYTVDEMRVLLDWLVDQAQQMELPIPLSKAEEEQMLERWGKR